MNVINKIKQEILAEDNRKVRNFLLGTIIALIIEIVIKNYLDVISMEIQVETNGFFSCEFLKKMMFFEYNGKILFYIIILQYSNVYSCFLFWFTSNSVPFLMTILKLIFSDDRPFWLNNNLNACLCATNFGSPSTSSFNIFSLSMFIYYKAPLNKDKYSFLDKKIFKDGLFYSIIFWNVIVCLVRFFQNAHSLNQLVFGFACGFWIYYLYYEILMINPESKEQFILASRYGLHLFSALICILIIFMIAIFFYPVRELTTEVTNRLDEVCPNSFAYLELDSYVKAPAVVSNAVMLLFLWIEYKYIFKSNDEHYLDNTFEPIGNRFNNNLPYWNIFVKLAIYLFIMIVVFDGFIVVIRDSRLTVWFWLVGPFFDGIFIGFLHVFGIRYLFFYLKLNNKSIKVIDSSKANEMDEFKINNEEECLCPVDENSSI